MHSVSGRNCVGPLIYLAHTHTRTRELAAGEWTSTVNSLRREMPDAEPRHRDTPDSTLFDSLRFDPISIRDALDAAEALSKAVHVPQPVPSSSAPNAQRPNARSRRPTHLAHTHAGGEWTSGRRLAAQRRVGCFDPARMRSTTGWGRPTARPTDSRWSERFEWLETERAVQGITASPARPSGPATLPPVLCSGSPARRDLPTVRQICAPRCALSRGKEKKNGVVRYPPRARLRRPGMPTSCAGAVAQGVAGVQGLMSKYLAMRGGGASTVVCICMYVYVYVHICLYTRVAYMCMYTRSRLHNSFIRSSLGDGRYMQAGRAKQVGVSGGEHRWGI